MTVAPGYVQKLWAFGGKVPGPVIGVKQGDTVRVYLKNLASNEFAHSIDFHASQTAWNDQMTSIKPGEEKLYEWRADCAGVWMYHCGSPHPLHHMANGLYGMVIVKPERGFKKVDHAFALVQSEWYLGPQREPVDFNKASNAAFPDYVVFNGVANHTKRPPPASRYRQARVMGSAKDKDHRKDDECFPLSALPLTLHFIILSRIATPTSGCPG